MYSSFFVKIFLCFCQIPFCFGDICRHTHAKRFYVNSGDFGILNGTTFNTECSMELVTAPYCVISLQIKIFNADNNCKSTKNSGCRCDYLWVTEPPYIEQSGTEFCDNNLHTYKSKTRFVAVTYFSSVLNRTNAFSLQYRAEINRNAFINEPTATFSTPFFPSFYPRDYIAEYFINCTDGRIQISFSDFQISPLSYIDFFDPVTQTNEVISGDMFRPPITTSSGTNFTIRFSANRGTGFGFKATYTLLPANEELPPVDTNCGGFVEDFGGTITMLDMVDHNLRTFDCLWIIKPQENLILFKTHLYLKVAIFEDFDDSLNLKIFHGLTSESPLLESIQPSEFGLRKPVEHIVPIKDGLYVSLKGNFRQASKLAIVYSTFNYKKCFSGFNFLCDNHRCIPGKLVCDNFDHCGDNSDETNSVCSSGWNQEEKIWYSNPPNYLFTKSDKLSDFKTVALIFLICSLGLIVFTSSLVIFLYRLNTRVRQQREFRERLQVISEILADNTSRQEDILIDEPPVYEPPPDYSEVVKKLLARRSERRRLEGHNRRRSRSAPRSQSSQDMIQISTPPPPYSPTNCSSVLQDIRCNQHANVSRRLRIRSKSCTFFQSDAERYKRRTNKSYPLSPVASHQDSMNADITQGFFCNWEQFDSQFQ